MGRFFKLVNTEEKLEAFKSKYNFPEDINLRYVPKDDLSLLQYANLILPMVAIIEGGIRIPMHPLLINFMNHYRLCPLQCVPHVFRIVMGTTMLNEKLGLDLIMHNISYV